jgi:DNA end-binding protein Ku
MARIWNGAISFGLVNIPISLVNGMNRSETVRFNLIRKSDHSRIHNKRIAEADNEEVSADQIVKGYEYEKDKYIEVTPEDLDSVAIKSTHTIDIQSFVPIKELKPTYFCEPYFIQPEKGGEKAFRLLTDVLQQKGMAGISKVVFRGGREHLVALIPDGKRLTAEVLHFAEDLQPADTITVPDVKVSDRELDMAKKLVESMEAKWNPHEYTDEYEKALKQMLDDKVAGKKPEKEKKPDNRPSNVIDLVDILQQSLRSTGKSAAPKTASKKEKATTAGSSPKKRKAA